MKKIILTFLVASITLISNAQQNGQKGQRMDPKAQTEKMASDLGLNDDQKSKVLTVNTDASTKRQALRSNESDPSNRRADMKKIETDRDGALKGILTDDQYKKYVQMREDERKQRQAQRGAGGE